MTLLVGFLLYWEAGMAPSSSFTGGGIKQKIGALVKNNTFLGRMVTRLLFQSADLLTLEIMRFPDALEDRNIRSLFTGNEGSWGLVYQKFDSLYRENEEWFAVHWGQLDDPLRKVLFLTTVTGNMWRVGAPGKVASVETFHKIQSDSRIIPVTAYLKSPYADCNDFATFLYMLLRQGGFDVRHVGTKDHIYLEISIDGRSYIVDAMNGFLVQLNIEEFLKQRRTRQTYYLAPLRFGDPASQTFRENQEAKRMHYIMTRGRLVSPPSYDYSHWDEYKVWLFLEGTEIDGNLSGISLEGMNRGVAN